MKCLSDIKRLDEKFAEIMGNLRGKFAEIQTLETAIAETRKDRNITETARMNLLNRYGDKLNAAQSEAREISERGNTALENLRAEILEAHTEYQPRPEQVNPGALEILDRGILSNAELMQFADRYAHNPAMKRIIGAAIRARADADEEKQIPTLTSTERTIMRAKADKLTESANPLESILASMGVYQSAAIRPDAMDSETGYTLYAENYSGYCEAAESLDSE